MKNKAKIRNVIKSPIQSDPLMIVPSGIQQAAEFVQFAKWLATPAWLREIPTQMDFADVFQIPEDVLTEWKKCPQFWILVSQEIKSWMKDRVADVVGCLYMKIVDEIATTEDVEMFLKIAGTEIISKEDIKK
jgi:hypothetical protein